MKEILIAVVTVLLPAFIAYAVYVYRPSIGFETHSASAKFSVKDGKIVHSQAVLATTVEVGSITLRNATRTDIENFEIVFEQENIDARFEVEKTKTLAASAISFRYDQNGVRVSTKSFPAKEKIIIKYSIVDGWGIQYITPKKLSGKFSMYSISSRRDFFKFMFLGAFFTLLAMCTSATLGVVVSLLGESL